MKSLIAFLVLCSVVVLNFHSASSSVIRAHLEKLRSSQNENHRSHSRKAPHGYRDASDSDSTVLLLVNRGRRNTAETTITQWRLNLIAAILNEPVHRREIHYRDLPPVQKRYNTCVLESLKKTRNSKSLSKLCRRKHEA